MHPEPLQTSTGFYPRFIFLRIRSSGFGLPRCDFRHFHTSPLITCGLVAFAAGPTMIILPLPHPTALPGTLFATDCTTPQSSTGLSLYGFRLFELPVTGSFQLSLTVLVRYRTLDVFTIGSRCLPSSCPNSEGQYSGYPLSSCSIDDGAITLSGTPFQAILSYHT